MSSAVSGARPRRFGSTARTARRARIAARKRFRLRERRGGRGIELVREHPAEVGVGVHLDHAALSHGHRTRERGGLFLALRRG
jgi:hypothetical protein